MTATVDKGTKRFTRVFLQESFRGGRIEAVADLIDRFEGAARSEISSPSVPTRNPSSAGSFSA